MTILSAIQEADLRYPNNLDVPLKVKWLSLLDGQIYKETNQWQTSVSPFRDYTETGIQKPLLVPHLYSALYPEYLVMRIALELGNTEQYNKHATTFNRLWHIYLERGK